jgi:hypothetical protein
MRKTFQIDGYAVNKRGNTVGIHYTLTSADLDTAKSTAQLLAQQGGISTFALPAFRRWQHEHSYHQSPSCRA